MIKEHSCFKALGWGHGIEWEANSHSGQGCYLHVFAWENINTNNKCLKFPPAESTSGWQVFTNIFAGQQNAADLRSDNVESDHGVDLMSATCMRLRCSHSLKVATGRQHQVLCSYWLSHCAVTSAWHTDPPHRECVLEIAIMPFSEHILDAGLWCLARYLWPTCLLR